MQSVTWSSFPGISLPGGPPLRAGVGEEICGCLDGVGGKTVGEVAVRPGLLDDGDGCVLKGESVRLVEAADGGVDVVVGAVGHDEDVVVLGRLGFKVRVGSQDGPASPDQWERWN